MGQSVGLVVLVVLAQLLEGGAAQRTHVRQGGPGGREQQSIRLAQGTLIGREVFLTRTQRVMQYLGIPFAQAPIGKLRFAGPATRELPSWPGVKNASAFAPSCPQVTDRQRLHEKLYERLLQELPSPGISEDCLYLNVYVPADTPHRLDERWPVMVWFHGGDFNTGTPAMWDPSIFVARQKMIVVTPAYRLNILGFFTTTDGEAPGNYGMLDQIAALDWVRSNIESFDGQPSNVVIAGHSSGAISVGLHLLSPLSRGKFHKAVAMSGDAVSSVRTAQQEAPVVEAIAEKFGCLRDSQLLMTCLRRVDVAILVQESSDIETWGPIVDAETVNATEPFLPLHPKDALRQGSVHAVPLVVGFTSNEQALAYIEGMDKGAAGDGKLSERRFEAMIADEANSAVTQPENGTCELRPELVTEAILFMYRPHPPSKDPMMLRDRFLKMQSDKNYAAGLIELASKISSPNSPAFVYHFEYRAKTPAVMRDIPEWAKVPHMFDLPFLWGLPYSTGANIQWTAADKKVSDIIMSLYSTFARTGNPSINIVRWEPYREDDPAILSIDKNLEMSRDIDYNSLAFWNEYYPVVLDAAMNSCCDNNNTATSIFHPFRTPATFMTITFATICWELSYYYP